MERVGPRGRMVAAVAAGLVAALLVAGLAGSRLSLPGLGLMSWLAVLIGINAGVGDVTFESLRILNPLDVALLVLAVIAFAGFWPGPGRPHRVWMGVALALPLVGVGVLLATGLAGRSGLMGAVLVMSGLMAGSRSTRVPAFLGIAAGLLLLVGDFTTTGSANPVVAGVVAVGYLSMAAWFGWVALLLAAEARSLSAGPYTM